MPHHNLKSDDLTRDARSKIPPMLKQAQRPYKLVDLVTHFAVDDTTCALCGRPLRKLEFTFWASFKRESGEVFYQMTCRDLVDCAAALP